MTRSMSPRFNILRRIFVFVLFVSVGNLVLFSQRVPTDCSVLEKLNENDFKNWTRSKTISELKSFANQLTKEIESSLNKNELPLNECKIQTIRRIAEHTNNLFSLGQISHIQGLAATEMESENSDKALIYFTKATQRFQKQFLC
jgi:hypothetical protein